MLDVKKRPEGIDRRINKNFYRRIISWGIFLSLLLAVGVPFYITSQPKYFARYKAMKSYYLTWQASTHSKMDCKDCHRKLGLKNVTIFEIKAIGKFYLYALSPPNQADFFNKPAKQACFECHTKYRTISPSGDLLIPHRAHVEVLKLTCASCHKWLVHKKNPRGINTPTMENCLKCHNGKQASHECKSCHTEKAYPPSHKASDWLQAHSERSKEIDCSECHGWTPKYCQECHSKRPAGHAGNWKKLHSSPAKINSKGCMVCHKQKKCLECHD